MARTITFPAEPTELTDRRLTVTQAADQVQVSDDSIRRAYLAGHLKVERFGARLRSVRVRESELNRWMAAGGKTR
jgi:excisionase family DNA binding protein